MKLALAITCALAVVDGDTLAWCDERIRLVGFDAPEIRYPFAKCDRERQKGARAKARLNELIQFNRPLLRLERIGQQDRYGRTLARLYVGGEDVAEIMVREGLARSLKWDRGERREPWC